MAEPLRNADELQKQLSEFQQLQSQFQMIMGQKQQLTLQNEEIRLAQEALAKSEKGIYRAIGPMLVETTKSEANADLKEKKELFEMRIGVLQKQEDKLRPRLEELRIILEKAVKENRLR